VKNNIRGLVKQFLRFFEEVSKSEMKNRTCLTLPSVSRFKYFFLTILNSAQIFFLPKIFILFCDYSKGSLGKGNVRFNTAALQLIEYHGIHLTWS
jgi:hypothetical protein